MTYEPNFSISFITLPSGNLIHDVGSSDKKTANGAAKSWMKTCGWMLGTLLQQNAKPKSALVDEIKVVVRPIECKDDVINMMTHVNPDQYIAREERHGASIFNLEDVS